jgi:hypothetical protein
MMMMSWPAASHSSRASRVCSATPPRLPDAGVGRMKASSRCESSSMRVLSPRIEPPCTLDEGSTASTAMRWPRAIRNMPSASMKVDLPTPGTPEMPMRSERPLCGSRAPSSACARRRWSARVDSTRVMALASARRLPASSPAASAASCASIADGPSSGTGCIGAVRRSPAGGRRGWRAALHARTAGSACRARRCRRRHPCTAARNPGPESRRRRRPRCPSRPDRAAI